MGKDTREWVLRWMLPRVEAQEFPLGWAHILQKLRSKWVVELKYGIL